MSKPCSCLWEHDRPAAAGPLTEGEDLRLAGVSR